MTLYSRKQGLVSRFDSVNRVYCRPTSTPLQLSDKSISITMPHGRGHIGLQRWRKPNPSMRARFIYKTSVDWSMILVREAVVASMSNCLPHDYSFASFPAILRD